MRRHTLKSNCLILGGFVFDKTSLGKQNEKISLIYDIVPSIFIFNLLTHIILEYQAFRMNP
jgi:hypothetical protein